MKFSALVQHKPCGTVSVWALLVCKTVCKSNAHRVHPLRVLGASVKGIVSFCGLSLCGAWR
ncbi:hypothetical protein ARMGADRAFT_435367 [Armillaria gallica]|uniref:Uncharacterized protein n=1 Tax=Armillaria gallica TaxID=47427 RepID=A0A2H3DGK5_ARMGA|nr:hypothetical protein ARMGADRAFT_435367 [Armillaria gallica]